MRATSASELLIQWLQIILKKFHIKADHNVLTSCTDSGSDVKKALEKVFPTMREWCISHITHLVSADAFGSHINHNKSKNSDMKDFLSKCWKVIEKVNKSKVLKTLLEINLLTEFGKVMKLWNSPFHHWTAMKDVFICLLRYWNQIWNVFMEDGKPFPIAKDRQLLLQLHSILYHLPRTPAVICYPHTAYSPHTARQDALQASGTRVYDCSTWCGRLKMMKVPQ